MSVSLFLVLLLHNDPDDPRLFALMTGDKGLRAAQSLTAIQAALGWVGNQGSVHDEITIVELHRSLICVLLMPMLVFNGGNDSMPSRRSMMILGGHTWLNNAAHQLMD